MAPTLSKHLYRARPVVAHVDAIHFDGRPETIEAIKQAIPWITVEAFRVEDDNGNTEDEYLLLNDTVRVNHDEWIVSDLTGTRSVDARSFFMNYDELEPIAVPTDWGAFCE